MKILHQFPPNFEDIQEAGMCPDPLNALFTYGDTIYAPGGSEVNWHLMAHEEVHERQQGKDPKAWWDRYINDHIFRVAQEAEAYARQYEAICDVLKDRNRRNKTLLDLSRILSGPLYGNVVSKSGAMSLIKSKINKQS